MARKVVTLAFLSDDLLSPGGLSYSHTVYMWRMCASNREQERDLKVTGYGTFLMVELVLALL